MDERSGQRPADILDFVQRAARPLADGSLAATLCTIRDGIQAAGGDWMPGVPQPCLADRAAGGRYATSLAHDDRAFADVMVYDTAIDDLPILVKAIRGALGPRPG